MARHNEPYVLDSSLCPYLRHVLSYPARYLYICLRRRLHLSHQTLLVLLVAMFSPFARETIPKGIPNGPSTVFRVTHTTISYTDHSSTDVPSPFEYIPPRPPRLLSNPFAFVDRTLYHLRVPFTNPASTHHNIFELRNPVATTSFHIGLHV